MVWGGFERVIVKWRKDCMQAYDGKAIAEWLGQVEDFRAINLIFGHDFVERIYGCPSKDTANKLFCNLLEQNSRNECLIWVLKAAQDLALDTFYKITKSAMSDVLADEVTTREAKEEMAQLMDKYENSDELGGILSSRRPIQQLKKVGIPRIERITYDREEESIILKSIKDLCDDQASPRALVVYGMGGVGKTTIVQHLLNKKANNNFFESECSIRVIVWLNVSSVSETKPFQEEAFLKMIFDAFRRVGFIFGLHSARVVAECTRDPWKLGARIDNQLSENDRLLLVLDDVYDECVLKVIENMKSVSLRCIAVTRDAETLRQTFLTFRMINVKELSFNKVCEVLAPTLENRGLDDWDEMIEPLASCCFGLPIIIAIVQSRLGEGNCDNAISLKLEYDDLMEDLKNRPVELNGAVDGLKAGEKTVSMLMAKSFESEADTGLIEKYYRFLFFDRGANVDHLDLTILWKSASDSETLKTCETIRRKSFLNEDRQFLNRMSYSLHAFMYMAALDHAKKKGFADSLESLRAKLVDADVLKLAVLHKRDALLQRIVMAIMPRTLADLCRAPVLDEGKTFLHFLYKTHWKRNVGFPSEENIAAELIIMFIQKLYKNNVDTAKILAIPDDNGQCVLLEIMTNENDESFEHQSLQRIAVTEQGGYLLTTEIKQRFFWRNELSITENQVWRAAILGDAKVVEENLAELSGNLSMASFSNGNTLVTAAAANGHANVLCLLLHHLQPDCIHVANSDGLTALMLASQNGFLNIVQLLVTAGALVDEKDSKYGRTSLMLASQHGHIDVLQYLKEHGANINEVGNCGSTALSYACQSGYLDVASYLCQNKANVNTRNEDGATPLMMACLNGNAQLVELLCTFGADVNACDILNVTALMLATENGKFEVSRILIARGADVNSSDSENFRPLISAAQSGHSGIVELLLDNGALIDEKHLKAGWTALIFATVQGHLPVVEVLCERNADVDATTIDGSTALMYADDDMVAETLLKHGANIRAQDNEGWNSLILAAYKGYLEIVQLMISKADSSIVNEWNLKNGRTALIQAAQQGHSEIVKLLVDNGADVNCKDFKKWTPLMLASQYGHIKIVRFLKERGANINDQNIEGISALMLASQNGHQTVVKYLSKNGAILDAKTDTGVSAFLLACKNGSTEIVESFFKDPTADANYSDQEGLTALMLASRYGHFEIVKLLVEKGSNVNCKHSKTGRSALMLSCQYGHVKIAKFLFHRCADPNAQDENGNTAVMLASLGGSIELVRFLAESGAALNTRNEDGFTALMIATAKGSVEIVNYLLLQKKESISLSVTEANNDGVTVFMLASILDQFQIVKQLFQSGYVSTAEKEFAITNANRKGQADNVAFLTTDG